MNRRGFFGWLAALLGAGVVQKVTAISPAAAKESILVVTLADDMLDDDEALARFYAKWFKRFQGTMPNPIILPSGVTFQVFGVFGKNCEVGERCGDYEWKVIGRDGKETIEMLGQVAFGKETADLNIVGQAK